MCARFSLDMNPRLFRAVFGAELPEQPFLPEFAPTDWVPVIRADGDATAMRWGLVPSWSRDERMSVNTFNARCESLLERPTFREAALQRRCLLPATAFYDWHGKTKMQIAPAAQPHFVMAGLWEQRGDLVTCTVVTCPAHEQMEWFQDRMPVILEEDAARAWMQPGPMPNEVLVTWNGELEVRVAPQAQPPLFD